jgi:hypothetical protein
MPELFDFQKNWFPEIELWLHTVYSPEIEMEKAAIGLLKKQPFNFRTLSQDPEYGLVLFTDVDCINWRT